MKKFNIAIVCDAIDQFVAGSFISSLRFAERLSKKGHKIIIITSKYPSTPSIDFYKKIKVYRLPSFPVPKSQKKLYFAYPNSRKIKKILENEKTKIVHFMVPTPLALSAIKVAKKLKLKIIGHSHTQPENWMTYLPKLSDKIKKYITNFAYNRIIDVYNNAECVICPSKFSSEIMKMRNLKSKIYIISNGVDTFKFKRKISKKYSKNNKFSTKTKKILFVGRLDPEKNIPLLINSVKYIEKDFKNFEILIVGDGSARKELEKLTKKLNVGHKVKFLGRISNSELIKIYNFCDIFALPSLVELEGMVVLEAMACGKPILIANSKESASKYFVKDNGFLFNPNNPKDFAKKALKLLKNEKLLKKMSEASYRESKKFDINTSVSNLEKVYQS